MTDVVHRAQAVVERARGCPLPADACDSRCPSECLLWALVQEVQRLRTQLPIGLHPGGPHFVNPETGT